MVEVILHEGGEAHRGHVPDNTNLVVQAGVHKFPHPNLKYKCGMGYCGTCACQVIAGGDKLPPPNWKERKRLGEHVEDGYRLVCQLWLTDDIEMTQDIPVDFRIAK